LNLVTYLFQMRLLTIDVSSISRLIFEHDFWNSQQKIYIKLEVTSLF
jgi:hypothetical protein